MSDTIKKVGQVWKSKGGLEYTVLGVNDNKAWLISTLGYETLDKDNTQVFHRLITNADSTPAKPEPQIGDVVMVGDDETSEWDYSIFLHMDGDDFLCAYCRRDDDDDARLYVQGGYMTSWKYCELAEPAEVVKAENLEVHASSPLPKETYCYCTNPQKHSPYWPDVTCEDCLEAGIHAREIGAIKRYNEQFGTQAPDELRYPIKMHGDGMLYAASDNGEEMFNEREVAWTRHPHKGAWYRRVEFVFEYAGSDVFEDWPVNNSCVAKEVVFRRVDMMRGDDNE